MSNLGMYQKMTTASKKVGGPQNFLAITALCGYCTLRFGEHLIKAGLKKLKTHTISIKPFIPYPLPEKVMKACSSMLEILFES